jgi:predicted transcriptional regulator
MFWKEEPKQFGEERKKKKEMGKNRKIRQYLSMAFDNILEAELDTDQH